MSRQPLNAKDGMVYTNGKIYGEVLFLGEGMNKNDFYEITKEEYQEILKSEQEAILNDQFTDIRRI